MRTNHLGLILIVFVLVGIMTMGGSLTLFFSLPGLLAVLGIVAGAFIFKFGFSGLKYCRHSREFRNQFCHFGSSVSINSGVLATIVGFIQVFAQVDWTNPKQIGLAVSIGLTTILYGFVLSLAFKLGMAPLEVGGQPEVL